MSNEVTITREAYERLKGDSKAFQKIKDETKTIAFYVPHFNSGHRFYEVKIVNETKAIRIAREETEKYKALYLENQKKTFALEDKKKEGEA